MTKPPIVEQFDRDEVYVEPAPDAGAELAYDWTSVTSGFAITGDAVQSQALSQALSQAKMQALSHSLTADEQRILMQRDHQAAMLQRAAALGEAQRLADDVARRQEAVRDAAFNSAMARGRELYGGPAPEDAPRRKLGPLHYAAIAAAVVSALPAIAFSIHAENGVWFGMWFAAVFCAAIWSIVRGQR